MKMYIYKEILNGHTVFCAYRTEAMEGYICLGRTREECEIKARAAISPPVFVAVIDTEETV